MGVVVIRIGDPDFETCPVVEPLLLVNFFRFMCGMYVIYYMWELEIMWIGERLAMTCHKLTNGLREREIKAISFPMTYRINYDV